MSDIWMSTNGELEVGPDGDFRLAFGSDEVAQSAIFRGKTVQGDFPLQPLCGASLEAVIGEANTSTIGQIVEILIRDSLTHDGFLENSQIQMQVFPVSLTELMAIVTIELDAEAVEYSVSIDLKEGRIIHSRIE